MNKVSFILQARVGSTRLPQKMVLPFYKGKGIFELMLDKLKKGFPNHQIILATSENVENDLLEKIAKDNDVAVFRGSENDVLERFVSAAKKYEVNNIIRVCADNPFLDISELSRLVNFVENSESRFDYVSFLVNGTPSIKTHFGFWAEYVRYSALAKVKSETDDIFYHEHVTNYIYGNPDSFNIKFLEVTPLLKNRQDIRMTLDTKEDFNILSDIFSEMAIKYGENVTIDKILNYVDNNRGYLEHMISLIQQNQKK